MERHAHWDRVFEDRSLTAMSWYEQSPRMSLEMIDLAGIEPHEAVLDVGGGASPFAGALLARGFADVTVLDLSEVAVRASRAELGPAAARVAWIRADILDWTPERTYGLWHDRAAFHFLVEVESRERYLATARLAVRPGGHVVIGTFAEDGPTTCSGLPVARYDAEALADAFGPEFTTVGTRRDEHRTPGGAHQAFTWVALRRRERSLDRVMEGLGERTRSESLTRSQGEGHCGLQSVSAAGPPSPALARSHRGIQDVNGMHWAPAGRPRTHRHPSGERPAVTETPNGAARPSRPGARDAIPTTPTLPTRAVKRRTAG